MQEMISFEKMSSLSLISFCTMTKIFNFFEKIFYILFQSPVFIIQIKEKELVIVKGKLNSSFINDCKEIISIANVDNGVIFGKLNYLGDKTIKGSLNISKDVLQQIRNVW